MGLEATIEEQKSHGSENSQAHEQWKLRSKEYIVSFLSHFRGGAIDCIPEHQEDEIVKAMKAAVKQNNFYVSKQEKAIAQLENELAESHNQTGSGQRLIDQLENELAQERKNNADLTQNSGQNQKRLEYEIQQLTKKNTQLSEELDKLKSSKETQGNELS